MSLKRNIFVNYLSQAYVTIVGVLMLPIYIKYMGAEAYGLIGFFVLLQSSFIAFDMGLTPTLTRETARFRGGASDVYTYLSLMRFLEGIIISVACAVGVALFISAGYISKDWLQVKKLPIIEVKWAIQLMAAIIALRWVGGLYRGVISGSERLVWLGGYNAVIATFRFVGVLFVLIFIGATPTIFFGYQLCVAVIELLTLFLYAKGLLPVMPKGGCLSCSWISMKPVLAFALTIAIPSVTWFFATQSDKLVLSKVLTLSDYGYFSLAVLVASMVMIIADPVYLAIMPRMTTLEAEKDYSGLIDVYRQSTQLVAVIAGAVSVTLAFCAESVLWVWTGDLVLAHKVAPILILYVLGNAILAISAFPFYLQYAKGDLRLHLLGSTLFVVVFIPSIIWVAIKYGGVGAGYVWLTTNMAFFVFWLPFVHNKFAPGLNIKWYARDVLLIYLVVAATGTLLHWFLPISDNRLFMLVEVIIFGVLVLFSGAAASSAVWSHLKLHFNWDKSS